MVTVTTTAVGVARQIIDDPALIALLQRLSAFDNTNASKSSHEEKTNPPASAESVEDAVMMDVGGAVEGRVSGFDGQDASAPSLDIDGLVAELDKFPRWRFQEQVSILLLFHGILSSYCNKFPPNNINF